ncbi:MAG TPA: GNAT family N-acetyltransferase [Reyranella sp.]|jgi:GNAT superfamily N-acetyltransferase
MVDSLSIAWCCTVSRASELADFFAGNVGPDYISHAELQGERALSPTEWRPDLREVLRAEIAPRLAAGSPGPDSKPIAVAEQGGALLALAYVTFAASAPVPFAIVEDLIVSPGARGRGVGKAMLDWIAEEARARGVRRLFLESGIDNERAHDFFEREGFRPTSVVMMKSLG